ncbi:MAG: MBL fold metallo-hydrolase [SAR324 cluster bacterium]|nr:MBL fold metallo-hydrolase [SAR324 cluster bacterium]
MIKVSFMGVGSAFSRKNSTSSILVESGSIKMLVDCGTPVIKSIQDFGLSFKDITHIFVTHLHADHIGGLEFLALECRFHLKHRPKIVSTASLLKRLWNFSLKGGLEYVEATFGDATPQTLNDYFECVSIQAEEWFRISTEDPIQLFAHASDHVLGMESYSLEFSEDPHIKEKTILFTGDTRLDPKLLEHARDNCQHVLHDCQLFDSGENNKFGVHTSYQQLLKLPPEIRQCLWLYHYGDTPLPDAKNDGFLGFIEHHQSFTTS